ncbi:MAG: hypothetical protein OI74_14345 [Gammaproteobacteria bacterium (ex Lamellibrachia satsuma)]|nr:MAG: hypothetical protein HPY30_06040 [Gammaproteobacteria bacterium (ex Lamellibrachia satsuma)]RRS31519.1 MAG: hypothetical protein OI74_14345 [Gammaproteobacteria bacterium (ex Lamellibrachia satsuma)]RRS35836.1 MAG: hypothetical protein NV67_09235 [Gammaproteobacteria bacterium (ex Lamellibrachia satsuma)]
MTEESAKQWLRQTMLNNVESYSLSNYAGPTAPRDLAPFLRAAASGLIGTVNGGSKHALSPMYSFMDAQPSYSAGQSKTLYTYKVGAFFCRLFRRISSKLNHKLTMYDLWHGHFVNTDTHGMVIIFHAKEQPSNFQTDGVDNTKSPFATTDACFNGRNVLWLSGSNRFYALDTGDGSDIYNHYLLDSVSTYDKDIAPLFIKTRTVWEYHLGTQRGLVYYKIHTSKLKWKSTHVVIAP